MATRPLSGCIRMGRRVSLAKTLSQETLGQVNTHNPYAA
jgi:hypothetical protein